MAKRRMLLVTGRDEWHAWLAKHQHTESEVWLVFFKTRAGRRGIPYEDAVEEALCFGWIDSLVRRLDDDTYARKFTPRTDASRWSDSNRRRVAKLVREGKMTPAGMAKVGFALAGAEGREARAERARNGSPREGRLTPKMKRTLRANSTASQNFRKLAPSYRRLYVGWVMSAKREETRERRFLELVGLLARGEKLGMK
jgi:uncharacterized protein YdeI (YjbR/CyaY-like superfamily)